MFGVTNEADLNGSGGVGGALTDVVESCGSRFTLTVVLALPAQVDDQRLFLKQAHEMTRLFALRDTNLRRHGSYGLHRTEWIVTNWAWS